MQQHKISEAGLQKARKRAFMTIPITIAYIGILLIVLYNSAVKVENISPLLPGIGFTMVCILAIRIYSSIQRVKNILGTYTLTISENTITREQKNTPTIMLYFSEISKIAKNKKGRFIITGKDKSNVIFVPAEVEDRDKLEYRLNEIMPVVAAKTSIYITIFTYIPVLIMVGGFLYQKFGTNQTISNIFGFTITGTMLLMMILVLLSKNTDKRVKTAIWIFLALPALGLIIVIIQWYVLSRTH